MRFLPLLLILFFVAIATTAHAQQQEKKIAQRLSLSQRINSKPDESLNYNLEKSSFSPVSHSTFSKNASLKEFGYDQKFSSKSYDARSYGGSKSWLGDFLFSTKSANTKKFADTDKGAPVKSAAVKDAQESGKSAASRDYPGQRPFEKLGNPHKPGESGIPATPSGAIDWTGSLQQLNIDQVRDLLNKSK